MAVMAVLLLTLRNQLGHIYTDDPEVGYWMSVIAPLTALFQVGAFVVCFGLNMLTEVSTFTSSCADWTHDTESLPA